MGVTMEPHMPSLSQQQLHLLTGNITNWMPNNREGLELIR